MCACKVSVAVVAKALGEKWRGLSDEQRAVYKARAAERAAPASTPDASERAPGATVRVPKIRVCRYMY